YFDALFFGAFGDLGNLSGTGAAPGELDGLLGETVVGREVGERAVVDVESRIFYGWQDFLELLIELFEVGFESRQIGVYVLRRFDRGVFFEDDGDALGLVEEHLRRKPDMRVAQVIVIVIVVVIRRGTGGIAFFHGVCVGGLTFAATAGEEFKALQQVDVFGRVNAVANRDKKIGFKSDPTGKNQIGFGNLGDLSGRGRV